MRPFPFLLRVQCSVFWYIYGNRRRAKEIIIENERKNEQKSVTHSPDQCRRVQKHTIEIL